MLKPPKDWPDPPKRNITVDPREFPRSPGESWWVVHPNTRESQFCIPYDAVTVCTKDFLNFKKDTIYNVEDGEKGWVTVLSINTRCTMPQYVFARYFDAEAFVVGPPATPEELERAKPFDYRPTLPARPKKQLELFEDNIPGGLGE